MLRSVSAPSFLLLLLYTLLRLLALQVLRLSLLWLRLRLLLLLLHNLLNWLVLQVLRLRSNCWRLRSNRVPLRNMPRREA